MECFLLLILLRRKRPPTSTLYDRENKPIAMLFGHETTRTVPIVNEDKLIVEMDEWCGGQKVDVMISNGNYTKVPKKGARYGVIIR